MSYSIIKEADHEFIVRSEEQDILKTTSRRKAAKTVADANDLMRVPIPESGPGDDIQPESEPLAARK
jgi:hypothetical protein